LQKPCREEQHLQVLDLAGVRIEPGDDLAGQSQRTQREEDQKV